MIWSMATAVERFRARFRLETDARSGRQSTADERMHAALDLHAFNLLLTIDKVRNQMEGAGQSAIMNEVNQRRLAGSPMPLPLARRAPRRDANVPSH